MKSTQWLRKERASGGFSLIELLVAIAVVSVLALLTFVGVKGSKEQAKKIGCTRNLQQIGAALLAYAADNRQMFPFQPTGEPHYTPMILGTALVGNMGANGYLQWNGDMRTRYWSDAMLCPGDPNRALYAARTADIVPVSYMYRQNAQAGRGTTAAPSVRLSLLSRPANLQGYQPWIMSDRHVSGPQGIVKPYPAKEVQLKGNGNLVEWYARDSLSQQSYWHPGGTTVLYQDGSTAFRRYGVEPIGR